MQKATFDNKPDLVAEEGNVIRINYEVEEEEQTIDSMHEDEEPTTRTVYKAYVTRVARPLTYDSIVSAIINAEYTTDQMQAVINNHLLDSTNEATEAEFTAMQQWRALAKKVAREVIIETDGGID